MHIVSISCFDSAPFSPALQKAGGDTTTVRLRRQRRPATARRGRRGRAVAHRHKPNNTVFAAACVVGRCRVCTDVFPCSPRHEALLAGYHGSARKRTTLTGGLWLQSVEGVERAGPFWRWLAGLGRLALGSARPPSQNQRDCEAVSSEKPQHGEREELA